MGDGAADSLVDSLCFSLDHYSQISDVQTLAMLCSVFKAQAPPPPPDSYALFGHHTSRASVFPPHHARYVSQIKGCLLTEMETAELLFRNEGAKLSLLHIKEGQRYRDVWEILFRRIYFSFSFG